MHVAMMVKNEGATLAATLASVPWRSGLTVVDTGSTDDTVDVARAHMANVHRIPWPGRYDEARNLTLDLAQADRPTECLVLLDGEETWEGPPPAGPGCVIQHQGEGWEWYKLRVLPPGSTARYTGAVHEVLAGENTWPIVGRVRSRTGQEGSSSCERWASDAEVLATQPDDPRSVFYHALSRQWIGEKDRARELFLRRLEMQGWEAERYESMMRLAQLAPTRAECGLRLSMTIDRYPARAEPWYEYARHAARRSWWQLALEHACEAAKCTMPADDFLFRYVPAYGVASWEIIMRAAKHVGGDALSREYARKILALHPNDPLALAHV